MIQLLLAFILLLSPAIATAAVISGGGSGGSGGAGDVGSISATTATNPSAEATLKELTLTTAALNSSNKKLIYHASGRYTTAAAQTPTLRFRVYLCTVSGCGSGTVVTLADFTSAATTASTTNSWKVEGTIGTVSTGATGTVESKFWQQVQLGAAGDLTPETRLDQNNAASAAIDLTGVLYVRTTVLMSSANAGNSVTQRTGWIDGGAGVGTGGSATGASGAVQTSNGIGGFLDSGVTASGGTITGTLTGTATALAANGANCAAGQAPLGVNASGAVEICTDYMEEPAGNGLVARTAANTAANRTITGTSNQIDVTNGDGVAGNPTAALSATLVIPGPGIEFTETAGDSACAAGNYWIKANSTTTGFRKCQNGTLSDLDTGGGGSIGGSTGATDNAVLRADGVGGATAQASLVTINDTGEVSAPGGFRSTGAGPGQFVFLEGTTPADTGLSAGEHKLGFDSGDSKLKSIENGGALVTYTRTADNLSVFAATSSAQLASVLSDEEGSGGGIVRATSPTLTTPIINTPTFGGSAPTLADGVTWTFNPNGTSAGLNVGTQAGDPSVPNNGDFWYDSGTGKLRAREGGTSKDVIPTGAGTGDVTDVTAGAGIAVATPGGPAPAVSWDASTFVNNVVMWNAANGSRTWTANLSGATDPVITFSDGSIDVTTGTLKEGGVSVSLPARTESLTNKSLDCAGTGNNCTIKQERYSEVAGCNNATAGAVWNLPTTGAATPACDTGTNQFSAWMAFADAANESFHGSFRLPTGFTGGIDWLFRYKMSAGTTNAVGWCVQLVRLPTGSAADPAFPALSASNCVSDTIPGTVGFEKEATISSVTCTSCAAGDRIFFRVSRDGGGTAVTDSATGVGRLVLTGPAYAVVY